MEFRLLEAFDDIFKIGASLGTPVVCAIIAGLIYAAKGKPWSGGAALGFFLGPFGIFIALVTGGKSGRRKSRQVYTPQPVTVPQMSAYATPTSTPSSITEYRLPGRCPHCNAPVHKQKMNSPYTSCLYCGSQIAAAPV